MEKKTATLWILICLLAGRGAFAAGPFSPPLKFSDEWTFELDAGGLPLSAAINSGTNSPLSQFAAGYGSSVFTTNRALLCIGKTSETDGVWTNGAILDAGMTSSTSGVHYLRYDVAYDLSSVNNSGTVFGVYFTGETGGKSAGLVMGYDKGRLTSTVPAARRITAVPGAAGLTNRGSLTAIAEVNLNAKTLKVWYGLNGTNPTNYAAPAFAKSNTLSSINNLRFHATGDFRPDGSTNNYAVVDNIRHTASWADAIEPPLNLTAPPVLTVSATDSQSGAMDIGETNAIQVVIRNSGGLATNATSTLSHTGDVAAFTIISNNAAQTIWPNTSITNTYTLIANTNGVYTVTIQALPDQPGSAATNLNIIVGSQISYLTNTIVEVSGGMISGKYEPGETIDVSVISINNGAKTVSNTVNSLSADPACFTVSNRTTSIYPAMPVGAVTSTVYRVTIHSATTNGTYWFSVTNQAGTKVWSDSFLLSVFNQSIPSVSPASITISVLPGAAATNTEVVVTNSGNASLTFNITDNGIWNTSYIAVQGSKGSSGWVTANSTVVLNDPKTNSIYIEAATEGVSSAANIGFGFPFYGQTYSNFYVTADGYIGLINTTNVPAQSADSAWFPAVSGAPLIAPFWGNLSSPAGSIKTILKDNNCLVISYSSVSNMDLHVTGLQFQTALYTDGRIEFRYKTITGVTNTYGLTNVTIGIQGSTGSYTNLLLVPVDGTSVLLTPQPDQWVHYTPTQNVTVEPQSSQAVTFIANASGKSIGDGITLNAVFHWSAGGSNVISVSANVVAAVPVYSAVSSLSFTGAAGQVTSVPFIISNTGNGPLNFTISNSAAATAGYITTNPPYSWVDISSTGTTVPLNNPGLSRYITAADEGFSPMIPLRFPLPFYGGVCTQLSASVNGAIQLDATNRLLVLNLSTTLSNVSTRLIAPYSGDLLLDENATLKYASATNRFVITWENVRQYGINGGSNQTFQALLTPDGNITFQYKKLEGQSWANTTIGLRDTSNRTVQADIRQASDRIVATNQYDGRVYTQYVGAVSNRTVQFLPEQIQVVRYTPSDGSIPAGSNAVITITGDASNQSAGTNSISANATLTITHNASTNVATLDVTFTATNSFESVFMRASALADGSIDSDGDGISDDQERIAGTDPQNADSVFTPQIERVSAGTSLSWPAPLDGVQRNYTLYFTTNLMSLWEFLYTVTNGTTYLDAVHSNVPVIYYKITVPVQ